jgi:hypothetical protein
LPTRVGFKQTFNFALVSSLSKPLSATALIIPLSTKSTFENDNVYKSPFDSILIFPADFNS